MYTLVRRFIKTGVAFLFIGLILAPSSTRYRVAWETWLGRRGGWGCGSSGERSLTALQRAERR